MTLDAAHGPDEITRETFKHSPVGKFLNRTLCTSFKSQDMAEDYGEKRWDELSRLLFMETERKLMFGPGKGILEQVEPRLVKYSVLGKEVTRRYEKNVDTGKTRLISIDWNI